MEEDGQRFVAWVNVMRASKGERVDFAAPQDYFQKTAPERVAALMYDAVMSEGVGRCVQERREREEGARGGSVRRRPPPTQPVPEKTETTARTAEALVAPKVEAAAKARWSRLATY